MLGAIIGDIIGSAYEFHNVKYKDFPLWTDRTCFTDDTILICATAYALMYNIKPELSLKKWGKKYASRKYENDSINPFGDDFMKWLDNPQPYNAKTNGCIMRISPVLSWFNDINSAMQYAYNLTKITHNHTESFNATGAYIETGFMLKNSVCKNKIKDIISNKYNYDLYQDINQIRENYNKFYCSCAKSVPQSIICALDSTSYEDTIRNAISLGGDSDTLACMAGGLAEIIHPIPTNIQNKAILFLDTEIKKIIMDYYSCLRKNK